jgi:hypothetical protein
MSYACKCSEWNVPRLDGRIMSFPQFLSLPESLSSFNASIRFCSLTTVLVMVAACDGELRAIRSSKKVWILFSAFRCDMEEVEIG